MAKNEPDSAANKNNKYLTAVKMGLEVLMVVGILIAIYWAIIFIIDMTKDKPTYPKDDLTAGLIGAALLLLFSIIGLVGVLKESKCIVIVLLILVLITAGVNLYGKQWWDAAFKLIVGIMSGAFLYFIIQKEKSDTTA